MVNNRPQWKIYRAGEYIAATLYPEDAAALCFTEECVVKWQHRAIVWREGAENFSAGQSYDQAADVMRERRDEYRAAARARSNAKSARRQAEIYGKKRRAITTDGRPVD